MEFLRRAVQQIRTQLGALTISQRLVFVLLLVIMVGAIWWGVRYAAQREMVPLLDQSFTENEQRRIVNRLETWEEEYDTKGDKIIVPRARQRRLISRLAFAEALPEDTSMGWASLFEDVDIFTPESVREKKGVIILQSQLARTISSWPGISKAQVYINKGEKRRLNDVKPGASASVSVETEGRRPLSGKSASAIAALVSSASPRMKRQDVQVMANGQIVPVRAPEDEFVGGDYLEQKVRYQRIFREQILAALPTAGALVVVDVKPRWTKTDRVTTKIAEEGQGTLVAKSQETTREENSTSGSEGHEPGVEANVTSWSQGASSGRNETLEDSSRSNEVIPGSTVTKEVIKPGGVEEVTATVRIPLSYFEAIAVKQGGTEGQADAEAVKVILVSELPRLKQTVMHAIGLRSPQDDDRVVVNEYWANPMAAAGTMDAAAVEAGSHGFGSMIADYGKHIAVTALAIASLGMVLMLLRKANNHVPSAEQESGGMMFGSRPAEAVGLEDGGMFGDEDTDGILAGMELEGDAVRSRQVLEQIREMVKDSPDSAAALVGRWIAQDS